MGLEYTGILEKHGYKYYAFVPPTPEDNSATYTFVDEEVVREQFYYPFLKAGETVLDCGAGYGSYSLPALQKGCYVIIMTPPVPNREHEKLRMNLELNNFQRDYTIFDKAVYSSEGWFNPDTKDYVKFNHHLLLKKDNGGGYVRCATIDGLLSNTGGILSDTGGVDFIKLDVEGAEYEALKGAYSTIHQNRPTVLVENHLFHDGNMEQKILSLLLSEWKDLGYMARVVPYGHVSHTLFTIQDEDEGAKSLR